MLLHQALDKTIKYCRISATELAKVSGVSTSRISQFRNGLFVEGRGSDLTSRAIDELIDAAAEKKTFKKKSKIKKVHKTTKVIAP